MRTGLRLRIRTTSLMLLAGAIVGCGGTELSRLKSEADRAFAELGQAQKPGIAEATRKEIGGRYRTRATALARRALEFARSHPDEPEAPEALAWVLFGGLGGYSTKLDAECDAAYDLLVERYLNSAAILPVCRSAWNDANWTDHAERFLRAALERSNNPDVRALACFSLGRHQQTRAISHRALIDPVRGPQIEPNYRRIGVGTVERVRRADAEALTREAESLFERTIAEFADARPMGPNEPPLGEQARGTLFRLRNLDVGRVAPEIEGEDLDGRPMRLSDYRGKVVLLTFWATWCGPCMAMLPEEKALVERLKGQPFAMVGVNGDEDRPKANPVSAKKGITWRSFWNGGPRGAISTGWGISGWPTVYVIDARGVIRHNVILRGQERERAIDVLVAEAAKGQGA